MTGLLRADGSQTVTLVAKSRTIQTLIVECTSLAEATAACAAFSSQGYAVTAPSRIEGALGASWQLRAYQETIGDATVKIDVPPPGAVQ